MLAYVLYTWAWQAATAAVLCCGMFIVEYRSSSRNVRKRECCLATSCSEVHSLESLRVSECSLVPLASTTMAEPHVTRLTLCLAPPRFNAQIWALVERRCGGPGLPCLGDSRRRDGAVGEEGSNHDTSMVLLRKGACSYLSTAVLSLSCPPCQVCILFLIIFEKVRLSETIRN